MDRNITPATEVPNELERFLELHPSINRIVLNGKKAERSFHRLMPVQALAKRGVDVRHAPSTSPANTRISESLLLERWRHALTGTAGLNFI